MLDKSITSSLVQMNDKKSVVQKISEFGVILIVLVVMFYFFKSKWSNKKQISNSGSPSSEVLQQEAAPLMEPETDSSPAPETNSAQVTDLEKKEAATASSKKPDPLLVQITSFSNAINEKFEFRLRSMFHAENKEEMMDKYLALKQERAIRMHELLKTTDSRAAGLNVNYEFHNKFYAIIGKELYIKYLKILKETNEDSKKTKIVLEF